MGHVGKQSQPKWQTAYFFPSLGRRPEVLAHPLLTKVKIAFVYFFHFRDVRIHYRK